MIENLTLNISTSSPTVFLTTVSGIGAPGAEPTGDKARGGSDRFSPDPRRAASIESAEAAQLFYSRIELISAAGRRYGKQ